MRHSATSNSTTLQLLDRLGSDSAFRGQMLTQPKAALAEYGFDLDDTQLPAERSLPSMQAIQLNRTAIASHIGEDRGFFMVFFLR